MDKFAHVIFVNNPFEPFKDTETCRVIGGKYTIRKWLKRKFGRHFKEFARPTICLYNGKPILRKCWGRKIKAGDTINFVCISGAPIVVLYWIVAILVVASAVITLTMKAQAPNITDANKGDPTYTLRGQTNQIKLGQPIEVGYGLVRMWPSYAAQPYNQYIDNDQWLFQLFSLGQGQWDISATQIGDTLTADMQDVQVEIVPPGSLVTLFPTDVKVSTDVAGLELLGTNQGALDGTNVQDSAGDGSVGIAATDHPAYLSAGPYFANDTGTVTTKIESDLTLPNGCYSQGNTGALNSLTVTAIIEARPVDNAGTPTGPWATIITFTKTLATATPQRFTVSATVASGRYQVRASRTNAASTTINAVDKLVWEQLRAFIPDATTDASVTKVAVKARATNNLNDNSARDFNVRATRKLRVWDSMTSAMSVGVSATRSPVWAFVDAFTAKYGARLADSFLDLDTLVALDATLAARNEYFDWIFDQKVTVWNVAQTIAATVRAVPMLNGSRITMIRDTVKTFPVAIFNQENIVKNSFKWEIKMPTDSANDGLLVTYTDPTSWKDETVLCCMPDESGLNPETVRIPGITGRDHAYRTGMYMRRVKRQLNENYSWVTGMEGHIPSYGDMVGAAHDVPEWASGGMVTKITKVASGPNFTYQFDLTENAVFGGGAYSLLVRKNDGSVAGPYTVTAVSAASVITGAMAADAALDIIAFDHVAEPPLYLFGPSSGISKQVRIVGLAPDVNDTVAVTTVPYTSDLFTEENGTAPAQGNTHGNVPENADAPDVDGLRVSRAPIDEVDGGLWVQASWFPTPGARYYAVQFSYTAGANDWSEVVTTADVKMRLQVTARFLYVRVAAVAKGQGEWAYWAGQAPITDTSVVGVPTAAGSPLLNAVQIQADGTAVPRVQCTWVAPSDLLVTQAGYGGKYRLQYKRTADPTFLDWSTPDGSIVTDYVLDVKIGTSYDFRVRAENKWGGISAWLTLGTITVSGDATVPNAPGGLTVTPFPGYNEATWGRSSTVQTAYYEVWRNTSNSFAGSTKIGETDTLWFDDGGAVGGLTPGTVYWYFIRPISGSQVNGIATSGASTTTATAPVGAAIPSTPSAPTYQSGGVYTDGAGGVKAFAIIRIQALPANAVWQSILIRVTGGTSDWQPASSEQKNGTNNYDVRIDDLAPGTQYDVAMQAWSGAGGSTINPMAAPGHFTTASKTAGPGAPTSITYIAGNSASFGRAPMFQGKVLLFVARVNWVKPADADVVGYEYVISGTDSDAAADAVAFSGYPFLQKVTNPEVVVGNSTPSVGYFRVRAVNTSGVAGAWGGGGTSLATVEALPAGTMVNQDASNVSITDGAIQVTSHRTAALKVAPATASSPSSTSCVYEGKVSKTFAGGAAYETFDIDLTNRGFSAAPLGGHLSLVDTTGQFVAFYDPSSPSSTSTNARCVARNIAGGTIPAATGDVLFRFYS